MGVNLCVENPDTGQSHPAWDDARYAGDRDIFTIMQAVPGTQREANGFPYMDDRWWWRPTDFATFRSANWPDFNKDRWHQLADILEADASYWIYVSV